MRRVGARRKVPSITFCVKPSEKAWINLGGCNFNCKGCFAVAKEDVGRPLSVEELLKLFAESCILIYGRLVGDVVVTGGEPTLDPEYLIGLIDGLRGLSVRSVGLSTNGYLLDEDYVEGLRAAKVDLIKLDIKAYTREVHRWYTGRSNEPVLRAARLLHESGINFYARTIFVPGIVDLEEVGRIAKFLGSIDRKITYRIYEFSPDHSRGRVSRRPTKEEMLQAFEIAKRHLDNVEAIPASDVYDSSYEYVEVRDEGLAERFREVDEVSRSVIKAWRMGRVWMGEVLRAR